MSRRRLALWLVGLGVLLAVLAVAASLWLRGPQVDVMEVQRAPLVRTLQFSARVATLSRVDIGSTVTGRVAQVRVREGDDVSADQVLVQLEDSEWRAALVQAEAGEAQARARLAGLRSSGRSASNATLTQAEATLRAARSAFERARQLKFQGFYSDAQLDEARRTLDVAQAQQHSARAQVQANADTGTDIAQAQAQLDVARAASVAARSRLAQAQLLSPTQARVLVRSVEPGQIVQPGKALLSLALAGPTELVAQVDERFLEQLRVGQQASVVADAFPEQRFAARVLSIAPAVDAERGAIEVKFALSGARPAFLREDMTLSVEVETGRRDNALVLPQSALRPLASGAGDARTATGTAGAVATSGDASKKQMAAQARDILVVQKGRVQVRAVHLGLQALGAVEVVDGLAEGEQVLVHSGGTDGTRQPGEHVRPRKVHWAPDAAGSSGIGPSAEDAGSAMSNAMGR